MTRLLPTAKAGGTRRHAIPMWQSALSLTITAAMMVSLVMSGLKFSRDNLFQFFSVPTSSMSHTIEADDVVLALRYGGEPKRGDIVVFADVSDWLGRGPYLSTDIDRAQELLFNNGRYLVKRAIGIGGDEIECHGGELTVNGEVFVEPYLDPTVSQCGSGDFSTTVPSDHIFVLGDNRDNSADSRARLNTGKEFLPVSSVYGYVVTSGPSALTQERI